MPLLVLIPQVADNIVERCNESFVYQVCYLLFKLVQFTLLMFFAVLIPKFLFVVSENNPVQGFAYLLHGLRHKILRNDFYNGGA